MILNVHGKEVKNFLNYIYGEINQKLEKNIYHGVNTDTADVIIDNINNSITVNSHVDSSQVKNYIDEKISKLKIESENIYYNGSKNIKDKFNELDSVDETTSNEITIIKNNIKILNDKINFNSSSSEGSVYAITVDDTFIPTLTQDDLNIILSKYKAPLIISPSYIFYPQSNNKWVSIDADVDYIKYHIIQIINNVWSYSQHKIEYIIT